MHSSSVLHQNLTDEHREPHNINIIIMRQAPTEEFRLFVSNQYSSTVLLIVLLGDIVFNILSYNDWHKFSICIDQSLPCVLLQWASICTRIAAFFALCFVWWVKPSSENFANTAWSFTVPIVQGVFPVLISSALAFQVFHEVAGGHSGQMYVIPSISTAHLGLQLYPVIVFMLLKDTHVTAIFASWVIGVITLSAVSIITQSWDHLYILVGFMLLSGILMYDHHRNNQAVLQLVARLQDTLEENARLEVEAHAEELRAMIGNVAHDLKTPLTSILSGIEYMHAVLDPWRALYASGQENEFIAKAKDSFEAVRRCLRTMSCSNSFMTMAINRCVDYTKASKGIKLVPLLGTIILEDKIGVAVRLICDANSAAKIELRPHSSAICSHIVTDQQWLIENLLCLLSNATRYSTSAMVELAVHLQDCADADQVAMMGTARCLRFEVLDTGIGLTEDAMQTLFSPSNKQAQRLGGGTGLGLFSLAKRVEALHGQYGVCKRPDGARGSLFWFTIPYQPDEESAKLLRTAIVECAQVLSPGSEDLNYTTGEGLLTGEGISGGLSVMVVDDAPLVLKMAEQLLGRKGHRVLDNASNGAEALDRILSEYKEAEGVPPFDVVLMDLQMPVLDGIEAIRRLRAKEQMMEARMGEWNDSHPPTDWETAAPSRKKTAASPSPSSQFQPRRRVNYHQFIIAISANSDSETKRQALAAGADAFLAKPFTYEAFTETVKEAAQETT